MRWCFYMGSDDSVQHLTSVQAVYKSRPEDFEVNEVLPFEPEGGGEHVYLQIRKIGRNTLDLQRALAVLAGVPRHQVSYAGLKDRQAVTTQWFSVHLPGVAEPDWGQLEGEDLQLLRCSRHRRKLKQGAHGGNEFKLVLRQIKGDPGELQAALQSVGVAGFPNYFGEQRFGREGGNLVSPTEFGLLRRGRLSNRQKMQLSAARAFLFNEVLRLRVEMACWDLALPGDLINLDGSNSFFGPVDEVESLHSRLQKLEIHPTGPLPGLEPAETAGQVLALEQGVEAEHSQPMELIRRVQARPARRALRAQARGLRWGRLSDDSLKLEFFLSRGIYATALLQRLGRISMPDK